MLRVHGLNECGMNTRENNMLTGVPHDLSPSVDMGIFGTAKRIWTTCWIILGLLRAPSIGCCEPFKQERESTVGVGGKRGSLWLFVFD